MTYTFLLHSAKGIAPLLDYRNSQQNLESIFEASLPDGSVIAIITTHAPDVYVQLPKAVDGVTMLPHPHATRTLSPGQVNLLSRFGAASGDRMEDVLIKAIGGGLLHPRFHPDLF